MPARNSIRASLHRFKQEVIKPENEDRSVGVSDAVSLATDMADYAGTASSVVGAVGSQLSDVVGEVGAGSTAVMGIVGTGAAIVEMGLSIKARNKAKKEANDYIEKINDPNVIGFVQQRSHANDLMLSGRAVIADLQAERAVLEQERAKLEFMDGSGHESVHEIDRAIAAKHEHIGKIESAIKKADHRVTDINATDEMRDLHVVEAKAALANSMLKRSGDFRVEAAETGLKGLSTVLDVGQGTLGIAATAAGGAGLAAAALPIVGGAVSVVAGAGQSLVGAVSLIHNAYRAHKEGVRERKARDARQDIEDPELDAALKRVQNKAGRNKLERGVQALRDSTAVVAGASAAVAGGAMISAGVLGGISAPGFGVGAIPPLAVALGSMGIAVGAGAISAAAAGGAQLFKVGRHLQSVFHKNDAIRAAEAVAELQSHGMEKMPCDENGKPVRIGAPPLSPGKSAALYRLQKLAIKKGYLKDGDEFDPVKVGEFAKQRLITRDTRFAVDTLSDKLLAECRNVIQHRGGNGIVAADLPDTPAVNAARKMGMKDSDIVGMVNAAHDKRTTHLAKQTIAQKMGLRSGLDAEVKRAPYVVKRKP